MTSNTHEYYYYFIIILKVMIFFSSYMLTIVTEWCAVSSICNQHAFIGPASPGLIGDLTAPPDSGVSPELH